MRRTQRLSRTEREFAELQARQVEGIGRPGAVLAGVIRELERRPTWQERKEILEASVRGETPAAIAERLRAALKPAPATAKPAPTAREATGLRLVGEAAQIAERNRMLAEQPAGVLYLDIQVRPQPEPETSPPTIPAARH